MNDKIKQIRNEFDILRKENIIYLDSSATSLTPKTVVKGITEYYNQFNANIHRSIGGLSSIATKEFESARKKVADFIGARPEEIIFTKNCTESINFIANKIVENLQEGDEIILSVMEHNSNFLVWQNLAKKKNLKLKFIELNEDESLDLEQFKTLFTDKTRFLTLTHVSNVLGTINPLNEMIEYAHKQNCSVLIDAAQSVGHIPVDVNRLKPDFMAFSAHKMLGPTGVGVLFISQKQNKKLKEPFIFGGGTVSQVTKTNTVLTETPWKFEAGTPNIAGVIGFGKAIDYLNNLGIEFVSSYLEELTNYTYQQLSKIKNLVILGQSKNKIGLISFYIKDLSSEDINQFLVQKGFQLRVGTHCANLLFEELKLKNALRISFHIYNTKEEIDLFIGELKKIIKKLGGKL